MLLTLAGAREQSGWRLPGSWEMMARHTRGILFALDAVTSFPPVYALKVGREVLHLRL